MALAKGFTDDRPLTYWRIPNALFEPKGLFLGTTDPVVTKLNRWRGFLGFALILLYSVEYESFFTLTTEETPTGPHTTLHVGGGRFTDRWWVDLGLSTGLGLAGALLLGLLVVLATTRGRRARTALQMCWPLVTLSLFILLMAALTGVAAGVNRLLDATGGAVRFVVELLAVLLISVPVLKSLYLLVVGLFRSDDAHPLLAPVITPVVAWYLGFTHWSNEDPDSVVPRAVAACLDFGGPVSITLISAVTLLRLMRHHPGFPYLNGPLA